MNFILFIFKYFSLKNYIIKKRRIDTATKRSRRNVRDETFRTDVEGSIDFILYLLAVMSLLLIDSIWTHKYFVIKIDSDDEKLVLL